MNKPLRASEVDPYTSIAEAGQIRRRIFHFNLQRASKRYIVPKVAVSEADGRFDAKLNLRMMRSTILDRSHVDQDLLHLAEQAVSRQSSLTSEDFQSQIDILASDLSKIFD